MKIHIFCDAAYCPSSKIAGYGYSIVTDKGTCNGGAEFVGLVSTSTAAEMQAVANTIYTGLMKGLVCRGDSLVVHTDCMSIILAFNGNRKSYSNQECRSINYINKLILLYSLNIEFRHVKAHTKKRDANSINNRLCDKIASKALKQARSKLQEN